MHRCTCHFILFLFILFLFFVLFLFFHFSLVFLLLLPRYTDNSSKADTKDTLRTEEHNSFKP